MQVTQCEADLILSNVLLTSQLTSWGDDQIVYPVGPVLANIGQFPACGYTPQVNFFYEENNSGVKSPVNPFEIQFSPGSETFFIEKCGSVLEPTLSPRDPQCISTVPYDKFFKVHLQISL